MEQVDKKGIPNNRQSDMYFLFHNNFLYPPKYILSIANLYANNVELDASKFHGGIEANMYLDALGFNIVKKPFMGTGQKWLAVASSENWKKCLENHVWGADNNRAQQLKKM